MLDELFLAVGKAMYLANSFESKCHFVLRIAKLDNWFKETSDASATWKLAQTLKDNLLGQTIRELKSFPEIKPTDIELLEKAKASRNFIAHEGADIGFLWSASSKLINEHLVRLRQEVKILVSGDNLVSRWVYEIENKEPVPMGIQMVYSKWVDKWIFGVEVSQNGYQDGE